MFLIFAYIPFKSFGIAPEHVFAAFADFVNGLFQVSECLVADNHCFAVFFPFAVGCAEQVAHIVGHRGGCFELVGVETDGCQQVNVGFPEFRQVIQVLHHIGIGIALRNLINTPKQSIFFAESIPEGPMFVKCSISLEIY